MMMIVGSRDTVLLGILLWALGSSLSPAQSADSPQGPAHTSLAPGPSPPHLRYCLWYSCSIKFPTGPGGMSSSSEESGTLS